MQVVDFEQQQIIAQSTLAHKEKEVAQLAHAVQDSAANPAEVTRLSDMLKPVSQECTRLQAEFQKTYGPRTALVSGAAQEVTLPTNRTD